jgi:hypothetical protein
MVRFRHFNSGRLLTVKECQKPITSKTAKNNATINSEKKPGENSQSKRDNMETKLVLTLGDNLTTEDINKRIDGMDDLISENKNNLEFNPNNDPRINELRKGVDPDSVFIIENTIIDPVMRIKNLSVVKIKNLKYNQYLSTEIKRIDGERGEEEQELEEQDDAKS